MKAVVHACANCHRKGDLVPLSGTSPAFGTDCIFNHPTSSLDSLLKLNFRLLGAAESRIAGAGFQPLSKRKEIDQQNILQADGVPFCNAPYWLSFGLVLLSTCFE